MTDFHVGNEASATPIENSCVKYWRTLMAFGVAPHTHSCFEMAHEVSTDTILLDMKLPVRDGRAAARRLNADNAAKLIPVITLTGGTVMGGWDKALAPAMAFAIVNRLMSTDTCIESEM